MEKLLEAIGAIVFIAAAVFVGAAFAGTILWLIYDHIHALFPTAAAHGVIAYHIGWWDSVCVTWIFGLLVRSSASSKSKSK